MMRWIGMARRRGRRHPFLHLMTACWTHSGATGSRVLAARIAVRLRFAAGVAPAASRATVASPAARRSNPLTGTSLAGTPLAGTPLAGLHLQERWADQAQALIAGDTVSKAAECCRIWTLPA